MHVGHTKQLVSLILALLCFYISITEYAESLFNLTEHFVADPVREHNPPMLPTLFPIL